MNVSSLPREPVKRNNQQIVRNLASLQHRHGRRERRGRGIGTNTSIVSVASSARNVDAGATDRDGATQGRRRR